jgi:hypothetical protein
MALYGMGGILLHGNGLSEKFHQRADCKLTPSRDIVERLGNEGFENVYLVRLGVDMD